MSKLKLQPTARVISLRMVEQKDQPMILSWLAMPEMKEYFRRYPPAFSWLSADTFKNIFSQSYVITEDSEPVGLVTLANIDQQAKKCEFGLMIVPRDGKRSEAAVEALKQLFDYCFNYLGLNKVYAHVLPHREDIKHLLTKWSFKNEGLLRDNCFCDGTFSDEYFFGLTRADFKEIK